MLIRTWTVLSTVCLILAILFGGCLGERGSPPPVQKPPAILLDYQRTGGIAGFDDRLVIFDNGIALVSTKKTISELSLNESDIEHLRAIIAASRFGELEGRYTSARGGADLIQYRITYQGKTVQTEDTAIPVQVQPIIEEMDRMVTLLQASEKSSPQLPHPIP